MNFTKQNKFQTWFLTCLNKLSKKKRKKRQNQHKKKKANKKKATVKGNKRTKKKNNKEIYKDFKALKGNTWAILTLMQRT